MLPQVVVLPKEHEIRMLVNDWKDCSKFMVIALLLAVSGDQLPFNQTHISGSLTIGNFFYTKLRGTLKERTRRWNGAPDCVHSLPTHGLLTASHNFSPSLLLASTSDSGHFSISCATSCTCTSTLSTFTGQCPTQGAEPSASLHFRISFVYDILRHF